MTVTMMPRLTATKPTQGNAPSHSPPDMRYVPGNDLAKFLGWFSIGLGLAEVFAPDEVGQVSGVRQTGVLRAFGLREIVCGIGILNSSRPTGWMWARVAGDLLDIGLAGDNLVEGDSKQREKAALATAALVGVTVLDVLCSMQLSAASALADD